LASRDDFAGIAAARAAGFKSSLALPITIDDDVSVIFEMYSTRVLPFNQTVMAAVEKLGRLLGDILVRRRSELALRAAHSELARVSQFSAMGAMTASIGHEIQQPLAAMITGAKAGLRWLAKSPPDLDEVRQVLEGVVRDGHRTRDILDAIRAVFKKDNKEIGPVDVNDLIGEVLELAQGELQKQRVSVHSELADQLPQVLGNRIQLQQVILNLTVNAIDAMTTTTERERLLRVKSEIRAQEGVLITVEDSGADRSGRRRAHLRCSFHHKVEGNGNGPVDLPIDRRSSSRTAVGNGWRPPWIGVSRRIADRRRGRRIDARGSCRTGRGRHERASAWRPRRVQLQPAFASVWTTSTICCSSNPACRPCQEAGWHS
jgi:hypothetical protein